jgi:hypothetical protein
MKQINPNRLVELRHGDSVRRVADKEAFPFSTVAGICVKNGDCVIEAYERMKRFGHWNYAFATSGGVMITNSPEANKRMADERAELLKRSKPIENGQRVWIEGHEHIAQVHVGFVADPIVFMRVSDLKAAFPHFWKMTKGELRGIMSKRIHPTNPNAVFIEEAIKLAASERNVQPKKEAA